MKSIVEFIIAETRCRVVPAPAGDGGGQASGFQDGPGGRPDDAQVIGSCSLNGRRYLILGDAGPPGPVPARTATVLDRLTQRELEVAVLVGRGLGNKQIADRLHLSEWTVSSYMRRIFVKLGVRTRAAMVARVIAELADGIGAGVGTRRPSGSPPRARALDE